MASLNSTEKCESGDGSLTLSDDDSSPDRMAINSIEKCESGDGSLNLSDDDSSPDRMAIMASPNSIEKCESGDGSLNLSDDDSGPDRMEIMSNYQKHRPFNSRKGRVCKSASDRRFNEMAAMVCKVRKTIEIGDWVILHESFKKMNKLLEKVVRVSKSERVLSLYIKALVMLEDFVSRAQTTKEAKKLMGRSNSKALNSLKQNLKKNNKQYEERIIKYRENPETEELIIKYLENSETDKDGYSSEKGLHDYIPYDYMQNSETDEDGFSSEEEPHDHVSYYWCRPCFLSGS